MTHRVNENLVVICGESDARCEMCGAVDELRPYGPNGERVCFDCAMKDEPAAKRQFARLLGDDPQ